MTYVTKMTKDSNGWKASSEIIIGVLAADYTGFTAERVLRISTRKDSRGNISSFAATCERRDTDRGYKTETHGLYEDYSKKVLSVVGKKATEKEIMAVHEEALLQFPRIIDEAEQFYKSKEPLAACNQ